MKSLALLLLLCACAYSSAGGCSCKDLVNKNGWGNCQKAYGGDYLCYVNQPSTCRDAKDSGTNTGEKYSMEACAPIVNCEWSGWVDGDCSRECGSGQMTSTRTVDSIEENGGTSCSGPSTKTEECLVKECPVHCEWNEWKVGVCSKTCGGGTQTNTRTEKVSAEHGGDECEGPTTMTDICNTNDCPAPEVVKRVAEKNTLKPACAAGTGISVVRATYGKASKKCRASNSLTKVKGECQGMQSCSVLAVNDVFGDPCRRTTKYLEVAYKCEASALALVKRVAENKTLKLTCAAGTTIKVVRATYGKAPKCKSSSSLSKVKDECQGKRSCSVRAKNSVFGEPCRRTTKYLEVAYQCK